MNDFATAPLDALVPRLIERMSEGELREWVRGVRARRVGVIVAKRINREKKSAKAERAAKREEAGKADAKDDVVVKGVAEV